MSRRLLSFAGAAALLCAAAASAAAQSAQPAQTTTVTTQTTRAVQNPDGTWTVVQYPADKEVVVDLTPSDNFSNATGRAKVTRTRDNTMISLDLSGLPAAASGMNLYAVDPLGKATLLGPVTSTTASRSRASRRRSTASCSCSAPTRA
jgi:ABC-type thiamine transport system substrate-binding protein